MDKTIECDKIYVFNFFAKSIVGKKFIAIQIFYLV